MAVCLNAGNPGTWTGPGNNTYFFDGAEPTLLDAGVGNAEHCDAIAALLGGRPLARVLVTHGHPDHASGVPVLRQRWPDLDAYKWLDTPQDGWMALRDGESIVAGETRLDVVHTPGHAADHICFWQPEARELYCGDMMTATTTILIPPAARGGSLAAYLTSLKRLAALEPATAWPAHGDVIASPVDRIHEYLSHRQERERQVLACIADGVTDLDGVVARVYVDTPQALWPAARLTVEALFEKLREDGRL